MLLAIIIALNFYLLYVHYALLLYREKAALLGLISCRTSTAPQVWLHAWGGALISCAQMDFFVKCTLSGSKTANGMEFPIFSATGSVPVKAFSAGVSL